MSLAKESFITAFQTKRPYSQDIELDKLHVFIFKVQCLRLWWAQDTHIIFTSASRYSQFSHQRHSFSVCFSDSVSGSAHYCWGGCLLSGRSWVHGVLEMQPSQLSCFSWWQCLSLEWYPTPSQPGRKGGTTDGKTILNVCLMTSHNLPSRILFLKRCFWIQSSLFAIPIDWIFNDLKG